MPENKYHIIAVEITWKDNRPPTTISYPGSKEIGIFTKHLVEPNEDPIRGKGISFRRMDTEEEFYWLPSGTWKSLRWIWNKEMPDCTRTFIESDLNLFIMVGERAERLKK